MSTMNPQDASRQIEPGDLTTRAGILTLILVPAAAVLVFYYVYDDGVRTVHVTADWMKLCAVVVLSLFIPLLAYSYFFFRRERRAAEVNRILASLDFLETQYVEMFRSIHSGPYFVISVGMVWLVSIIGLTILFFGSDLRIFIGGGDDIFPREGSALVFGMAFLGAYVWGLKYVFRRYALNDLVPGVFFRLSIRMIMASILALIIFNVYEAFAGDDGKDFDARFWPAIAFLLGTVPQRSLNWLMGRLPFLSEKPDPSVRPLPLEMIEGIGPYDSMRLEEIGIDDCYGLANYDFIPLLLKTSYDARKIADWILQAKLCVRCGDAVLALRQHGIHGIHDLATLLSDRELEELAAETSATLSSLKRARHIAVNDPDIHRLIKVAGRLSTFTKAVGGDAPRAGEPEVSQA